MKIKKIAALLYAFTAFAALSVTTVSCDDNKSYSELLEEESKAVNRFLVDQKVVGHIPADSVFEIGPDAPYYQIDEDGNIFMQVLNKGTGPKVKDDQAVSFRFTRWNLIFYNTKDGLQYPEGNADDLSRDDAIFRYGNFTLPSSVTWGSGIQTPLAFLNLGCEVNLLIKSQYGWNTELSYVQPYLYHVRYFPAILNN